MSCGAGHLVPGQPTIFFYPATASAPDRWSRYDYYSQLASAPLSLLVVLRVSAWPGTTSLAPHDTESLPTKQRRCQPPTERQSWISIFPTEAPVTSTARSSRSGRLSAAGAPLKSLKCETAAHGPEEGRTGFAVTVDRFTNRSGQPILQEYGAVEAVRSA